MNQKKIAVTLVMVVIAGLAMARLAPAQSSSEWRDARESGAAPAFTLVQSYHGTTPGTGNNLPKVEELKGKDGSWITWPGFMMKTDGSSRIFLQTTSPLEYLQKTKNKIVTLTFKDTSIYLSNNQNPLVTLHFNTPLRKAHLKRSKKNAELVMEMKVDAPISIMQVSIEDGYSYLFIDFPTGQYPIGGEYGARPSFDRDEIPPGEDMPTPDNLQVTDSESPF